VYSFGLLFADPEKNVHDGHRRMLRLLKPDWSVQCVSTGREAMDSIAKYRPNVLISELAISLEDGTDLLKAIQEVYPDIIRIVLSSEPDGLSEEVLRATQSAHRFLAKPCKAEELVEQIEKAANLRKFLQSPELIEVVGGIPFLPSLPDLYYELVRAIESPLISLSDIGEVISRDVSMTGKILQLVNSAFFGLPRKVTSPQKAVVLLGINILKALVIYVKIFFTAPEIVLPGLSLDDLWAHSSMTAKLSKDISIDLGASQCMQEDAFLAGMLHDVGKLLLLDHPRYFPKVFHVLNQYPEKELAEVEYEIFGTSHAEIGAYLLGLWGLPDPVVEAVACHHRPTQLRFENSLALISSHLANAFLLMAKDEPAKLDEAILKNAVVEKLFVDWQKKAESLLQERIK